MFEVCGGGTSIGGKVLGIWIVGLTRVSLSSGRIGYDCFLCDSLGCGVCSLEELLVLQVLL